jgi:dihydroorotase
MRDKSMGLYLKVNPPLRKRVDMEGLMARLSAGKVDWIETDHAPHTVAEKVGAPYMSGMPELDTYSAFVTKLIGEFRFPFSDILKITSQNAAASFGLGKRVIEKGEPATMTLLDMRPETVQKRTLRTKCGWSPYEGMEFPGRCKATIVGGNITYAER